MAIARACELYLIYYVPNVVAGTRVIIGIMLMEVGPTPEAFADVRFLKSWTHVRGLSPSVEIEVLQALEHEFRRLLSVQEARIFNYRGPQLPREWLLRTALDSFSNAIQISDAHPVMLQEPAAEIEALARLYLQTPSREARQSWDLSTRRGIRHALGVGLDEAGLMSFMRRDINVSQYTGRQSKLKLDFGYKKGEVLHLLHAQPLLDCEAEVAQIAYAYPSLKAGIVAEESAIPTLTLITEDISEDQEEEASYARGILADYEDIETAPVSQLDLVIDRATQELRM